MLSIIAAYENLHEKCVKIALESLACIKLQFHQEFSHALNPLAISRSSTMLKLLKVSHNSHGHVLLALLSNPLNKRARERHSYAMRVSHMELPASCFTSEQHWHWTTTLLNIFFKLFTLLVFNSLKLLTKKKVAVLSQNRPRGKWGTRREM